MFYELRAKSHIQIPCFEFSGGAEQTNKNESKQNESTDSTASQPPHGNLVEEVMKHLLAEYCNKVIPPEHGLCVTVSGIDKIGDARIFMEDGSTYTDVEFRLVMFKPYNNEVIEGEIANSDASGIRISMGFFEQVFIPNWNLPQPAKFDRTQRMWTHTTTNGDTLSFEKEDIVRLKVTKTTFKRHQTVNPLKDLTQSSTSLPPQNNTHSLQTRSRSKEESKGNDEEHENEDIDLQQQKRKLLEETLLKQPMIIYGSFNGPGLGPCHFWE